MKEISIVQNFICTMDERFEVLKDSIKSLANTFSDSELYLFLS